MVHECITLMSTASVVVHRLHLYQPAVYGTSDARRTNDAPQLRHSATRDVAAVKMGAVGTAVATAATAATGCWVTATACTGAPTGVATGIATGSACSGGVVGDDDGTGDDDGICTGQKVSPVFFDVEISCPSFVFLFAA